MSDEKHFMEEQWDDLSLPDSHLAWEKMEVLLDRDRKRRIIPFWFWRLAGLSLLLVGLIAGSWLLLKKKATPEMTAQVETEAPVKTNERQQQHSLNPKTSDLLPQQPTGNKNAVQNVEQSGAGSFTPIKGEQSTPEGTGAISPDKQSPIKLQPEKKKQKVGKQQQTRLEDANTHPDLQLLNEVLIEEEKEDKPSPVKEPSAKDTLEKIATVTKDSTKGKDTAGQKIADPIAATKEKTNPLQEQTGFVFSAGVGLQQAIAINGQQSSAYNYKGKQNSLSDRIPSVYLRLQKRNWFAQVEFHYAVPQPVEQVSFSQKTRYDVTNLNLNTEQFTIRKLYHHQLPVSINYFLLPEWSVGMGGMYSLLAGAVTEQEVTTKNVQTGNENVARSIAPVKGYTDSFFYKSTAGILFQTDYYWKRISLGLRYTQNVAPFIRYTKPDGAVLNETNRLLQAILRFRLF